MQLSNYKFKLALESYTKFDDKGKTVKTYKKGDQLTMADVLTPDKDCWEFSRTDKKGNTFSALIIKHYKVQEIRRLAGLVVYIEPELVVKPRIENGMTAVWQGAFRLPRDRRKVDIVIGESNKSNTTIDYVVSMAHKRWYDRAVLDCLELYEAYSDIETDEFITNQGKDDQPTLEDLSKEELEVIAPFVQNINKLSDPVMLTEYGESLKTMIGEVNASDKAVTVLRNLYKNKLQEVNGDKF